MYKILHFLCYCYIIKVIDRKEGSCINESTPNKETIEAMLEAERIVKDPSVKSYTDLDELFAYLKK